MPPAIHIRHSLTPPTRDLTDRMVHQLQAQYQRSLARWAQDLLLLRQSSLATLSWHETPSAAQKLRRAA